MGTGKTEHHIACRLRKTEQQTGQVGGNSLSESTEEGNHQHNPQHVKSRKERADINQHAHTNQEIGNKEGIADKFDAVHQRGHMRDVAVQDQSRKESTYDAFHTCCL